MPANWLEQRRRDELSERLRQQEKNRDPETEQAVIAYSSHRLAGGTMLWADFRREWLKAKGGADGR
jgi:hypothetical protein